MHTYKLQRNALEFPLYMNTHYCNFEHKVKKITNKNALKLSIGVIVATK
jgi:hypothetical protein